ncbi:MAG: c-type cytochrome [Chloroflexota bacterium]
MALTAEQKKKIHERYKAAKAKGEKFWPDVIYQDLLVSFGVFIVLVMLSVFLGVANEPKADPSDASYIPRPEWYFLFLYEMLKYFTGPLKVVGTFIIPTLAVGALILLPFIDRNPSRYFGRRKFAIGFMSLVVVSMVVLTLMSVATAHTNEETGVVAGTIPEQIVAGSDLYSVHCVECHGADGEGGEIQGVEGLEGFKMKPISAPDEMYTRTDETLFNVIDYGQPDLGMPPYGKAHGGELGVGDIEAIVTFMRYTWDDRAELPQEAATAFAAPALGPDEVPSYEVHIAYLAKRYCISCHRASATKENQNYYMETLEEILTSGDHAPNVKAGDMNSNLILMLHRQEIEAGGPMPPTKALSDEYIGWFERWVAAGMPNTAADAAAASGAAPSGAAAPTLAAPVAPPTTTLPLTSTVPLSPTLAVTPTP